MDYVVLVPADGFYGQYKRSSTYLVIFTARFLKLALNCTRASKHFVVTHVQLFPFLFGEGIRHDLLERQMQHCQLKSSNFGVTICPNGFEPVSPNCHRGTFVLLLFGKHTRIVS